jgi:hypothetical protein
MANTQTAKRLRRRSNSLYFAVKQGGIDELLVEFSDATRPFVNLPPNTDLELSITGAIGVATSLSSSQAYGAMLEFLTTYYSYTKSEDLAPILGSMSLFADHQPADKALLSEWEAAVAKVLEFDAQRREPRR